MIRIILLNLLDNLQFSISRFFRFNSDVPKYLISPHHDQVVLPDVALEVDGADVVPLCPGGFPVDGTLQHPGVLAGRAADGVDEE